MATTVFGDKITSVLQYSMIRVRSLSWAMWRCVTLLEGWLMGRRSEPLGLTWLFILTDGFLNYRK